MITGIFSRAALFLVCAGACGNACAMQELAGSGGAGHRFIYAVFMAQAGEKLNNPKLVDLSKEMADIAKLWRHFSILGAKNCKYRGGVETSFVELSKILGVLADRDHDLFKRMKKVI